MYTKDEKPITEKQYCMETLAEISDELFGLLTSWASVELHKGKHALFIMTATRASKEDVDSAAPWAHSG